METGIIGATFVAGLLSFFSPCILPLLPVYIGLLTSDANDQGLGGVQRATRTIAFVLGISVTFLVLGLGAGAVGHALSNGYVAIACGVVIFIFGLHLSGLIQIPLLQREKRFDTSKLNVRTVAGAFLLGLGFSFGWTPCLGPILGSVLALAAQQGAAAAGAALTLVYSFGMSIPFLIITLASNALIGRVRSLNRYLPTIQRIGGALIAIMGLWMIFTQVHDLSARSTSMDDAVQEQSADEGMDDMKSDTASKDDATAESSSEAKSDQQAGKDGWRHVKLQDAHGETHELADYAGKPVYLKFWASWCPTCVSGLDNLKALAAQHEEAGDVHVVTVVAPGLSGEMSQDEFARWAQEQGLDFDILMDGQAQLFSAFGVRALPTSVLLDSQGNVVQTRTGDIKPQELEKMISQLE